MTREGKQGLPKGGPLCFLSAIWNWYIPASKLREKEKIILCTGSNNLDRPTGFGIFIFTEDKTIDHFENLFAPR